MKFYFNLQYKMLQRRLVEFGLPPILAYLLGTICFLALSWLIFFKTSFAAYIYVFLALSFLVQLSESTRMDSLKNIFAKKDFQQLRLIENLLLMFPFFLYLLYQTCWGHAIFLAIAAIVLAFYNFNRQFSFTIPTPFYKYPFEFTVGFRKTYLFPLFAYFLCFMAIYVQNFNLGLFALLLLFLVSLSFYSEPEQKYYAWIFAYRPKEFIFHKLKVAILYVSLLVLPISLGLAIFFTDKILILAGVQFLAYFYLIAIVLAKYAVFPATINIAQAILFSICFAFPPFLLGVIPFFYNKSIKNLKEVLT